MEEIQERYSRQAGLVPADTLSGYKATVIGTGAIGRQLALQLAAMGVPSIELVDFDEVEEGNLAAQGFFEKDLGRSKVEAVADLCKQINSNIEVITRNNRYRRSSNVGNIVFCCVDSIDSRKFIHENTKDKTSIFIDGRMSAETIRVISSYDTESKDYYPKTIFDQSEAVQESCTAKSTIYTASVAAGIMIQQFTKLLRKLPVDKDILINLTSNEIILMDKEE